MALKDKDGALAELITAEARYLRTRNWVPHMSNGRISWRDPEDKTPRTYPHDVAVNTQRVREPKELLETYWISGDGRT